jgi:hypothetical protein
MLELIQYQRWWHPCTVCTMSNSSTYELQRCMSSCDTSYSRQAAAHEAYAIFVSFELIRRRRVRAPPMPLLRFNDKDPPGLSSVMALLDLQLIPLPHRYLPTRLLVEPLALLSLWAFGKSRKFGTGNSGKNYFGSWEMTPEIAPTNVNPDNSGTRQFGFGIGKS